MRSWLEKVMGVLLSGDGASAHILLPSLVLFGRVRKESDRASALEGCGQRPLVPGARARHAARQDLAAVADEPAQARDLLVVDVRDLLQAEAADLAVLPLRPARLSRCWSCR